MRPTCNAHHTSNDRAAAVAAVLSMLAMTGFGLAVVAIAARAATIDARAQASADAVALAAAAGGEPAGIEIGRANRVDVVAMTMKGPCIRATVSGGGAVASATALWELAWMPPNPARQPHRLTCRGF